MSDLISQRELDKNGRPNNLPSSSTPLIGREEEVHKVAAMLLKPDCRMVTIVGIGGMGKTSLALAVGRHLEHSAGALFAQGITFVALQSVDASTSDSEAVATAVAQTLKLQLPGRSAPSIEVIEYFEERDQLLILDNFEHLLGAAGWLGSILRRCSQIKLLVTSRELLYLGAEWRFSLGGLLYPVLSDQALELTATSEDFAAIQLFLQAAREARPDFTITAENEAANIECCQLLMGMPLAIRLAASWLRIMSVGKLIQELRRNLDLLRTQMYDIPVRQRSMRAVIDSTWILLHRDEQQILAATFAYEKRHFARSVP